MDDPVASMILRSRTIASLTAGVIAAGSKRPCPPRAPSGTRPSGGRGSRLQGIGAERPAFCSLMSGPRAASSALLFVMESTLGMEVSRICATSAARVLQRGLPSVVAALSHPAVVRRGHPCRVSRRARTRHN